MNLEKTIKEIKNSLKEHNNICSVFLRGSAAIGDYIPKKSDIDLSIILNKYDFEDISKISKILKKISQKNNIKIGIVYTDKKELDLDSIIGIHFHGDKNSNYTREIAENSKVLVGKDLRAKFLNFYKFDIATSYFDASKKLSSFIKKSVINEREAYKKGINYAFILSKQILHLNNIHKIDKKIIIKKLTNINEKLGNYLETFYQDSINWSLININQKKLKKMFNYLSKCKQYIGEQIKNE